MNFQISEERLEEMVSCIVLNNLDEDEALEYANSFIREVNDENTIDIEVERPLQCFEGGSTETCSCPDHGTALIDYEGE